MRGLMQGSILGMLAGFLGGASFEGYIPSPRVGPKKETGSGASRARSRLKAKHEANKAIPSGSLMTRQRRRAEDRRACKKTRITAAEFGRRKMKAINTGRAA